MGIRPGWATGPGLCRDKGKLASYEPAFRYFHWVGMIVQQVWFVWDALVNIAVLVVRTSVPDQDTTYSTQYRNICWQINSQQLGRSAQWSTKRTWHQCFYPEEKHKYDSTKVTWDRTISFLVKFYPINIICTIFVTWKLLQSYKYLFVQNFMSVYYPRVASLCSGTKMWMLIITPLVLIRLVSGCLQCCSAAVLQCCMCHYNDWWLLTSARHK